MIKSTRKKEINSFIKSSLLGVLTALIWNSVPLIVACVSFGTFLLINENNNLDPNTAFVSLTLFSMLRFPLNVLPMVIQGLVQMNVSMKRIKDFLLRDEINFESITHQNTNDLALQIENSDFGWNKEDKILNGINMKVEKGKLVAILGKVGCGKSSLLTAILGEMHKFGNGIVNLNGSTAYVPQQAWIQNATVKNNILFSSEFDEKFYDDVIKACALSTDLEIMPGGDETEIGEKGINLSGGQKQRVSLARAIYSNADVYLLDDPLSAVDAHVGKSIFDKAIGPNGILKDKVNFKALK